MKEITLEQREKMISNGAGWLFWIGGLTVVNSLVYFFGQELNFLFGLSIAQFVDGIFTQLETSVRVIGLLITFAMGGLFVYLGFLGRKKNKRALLIGLVIFALDSVLTLFVRDYWSFGFHLLAIFFLYMAIKNIKIISELNEIESIGAELVVESIEE